MNRITRSLLLTRVARSLIEKEGPLSFDQLFEGLQTPEGVKSVTASWKRATVEYLAQKRWISRSGPAGKETYCAESLFDLKEIVEEGEEVEEEVRRQRYVARREESIGKGHVLLRAVKKLLASEVPLTRNALFTPKKGDKFQERAAMIPTWQHEALKRLVTDGMVTQDESNPAKYSVADRELLGKLLDGGHHPCVFLIADPNEPCGVDHEATRKLREATQAAIDKVEAVVQGPDSARDDAPDASSPSRSEPGIEKVLGQVIKTMESQTEVFKAIMQEHETLNEGYKLLIKAMDVLGRRLDAVEKSAKSSQDAIKHAAEAVRSDSTSVKSLLSELLPVLTESVAQVRGARKEEQARFEKTVETFRSALEEMAQQRRQNDASIRVQSVVARLETMAEKVEDVHDRAQRALEATAS